MVSETANPVMLLAGPQGKKGRRGNPVGDADSQLYFCRCGESLCIHTSAIEERQINFEFDVVKSFTNSRRCGAWVCAKKGKVFRYKHIRLDYNTDDVP
jgi:hypothetical protein